MRDRKMLVRLLAGLLAALMVVGLLPMLASAEETADPQAEVSDNSSLDNLYLNKTAVLQDDGTWTITMEAYATGEVHGTVTRQVTPTDIIMVLDQSGSMVQESVTMAGSYVEASAVTNEDLVDGDTTYYYLDSRDNKYYPVTTTRQVAVHDSYWYQYSLDESGNKVIDPDSKILESAASGKVATSWRIGSNNVYFDTGYGYLTDNYRLFLATGYYRNYGYDEVDSSGKVIKEDVVSNENSRNSALNALRNSVGDMMVDVDSRGSNSAYYAIAYIPVMLVDNNTYYYTYTYTDDQNQLWTIGHSAQFKLNSNSDPVYYDIANGKLYTLQAGGSASRLVALQQSANTFISHISEAAKHHNVDHRIAVVGFAGNDVSRTSSNVQYQYMNTELFVGANQYNYWAAASGDPASEHYHEAFQSVKTSEGLANLSASISALAGNGPTYPSGGIYIADGLAETNGIVTVTDAQGNQTTKNIYKTGERKLVIVFMTDGQPGWSSYESDEASKTNTAIDALESTYGAHVYTVAVMNESAVTTNIASFLKNTATSGEYALAKNGVDLTNFFHSVEHEVENTTANVKLTENAFLADRLSEYFNMPTDITQANLAQYVSIWKVPHVGSHEFGERQELKFTVDTSASDSETDADPHVWMSYDSEGTTPRGITVHNWNFISDENLVITKEDDESGEIVGSGYKLVVEIRGITAKDAAAMEGYVYTNDPHSGIWDQVVDSNQYGKVKAFPMPVANLVNRTYVMDYGKPAMLDSSSSIRMARALDSSKDGVFSQLTYTGTGTGKVYDSVELTLTDAGSVMTYGNAWVEKNKLYYFPQTTMWNGYDVVYVFWTNSETSADNTGIGDPVTGNGWSRVSIIPANNVYYEDSFVTSSESGTVGIVYNAGSNPDGWKVEGNPAYNTEFPEGTHFDYNGEEAGGDYVDSIHGWIHDMSDDNRFSDGTAHKISAIEGQTGDQIATANFSFTGEGCDVYSYTDGSTGTILVKIEDVSSYDEKGHRVESRPATVQTRYTYTTAQGESGSGTTPPDGTTITGKVVTTTEVTYTRTKLGSHFFVVDNKAASGSYYMVPTVSFMPVHDVLKTTTVTEITYDLDGNQVGEPVVTTTSGTISENAYGTYKVTIYVTTAAAKDGNRLTYYLDGIRIYHPMNQTQENDPIMDSAYGAECDAVFLEVRQMLIDAKSFGESNPGFVFIDQINEDDLNTEVPPTENETTETGTEAESETGAEGETGTESSPIPNEGAENEVVDTTTNPGKATTTNVIGTFAEFGPKNEVYLAPGQAIAFQVKDVHRVMVGLKSLTGNQVTANVTYFNSGAAGQGQIHIGHTSELFYEVYPDANGYIVIRNATVVPEGGNANHYLLSIAKVKLLYHGTPEAPIPTVAPVSEAAVLSAVNSFDASPVMTYTMKAPQPEIPAAPVTPETPDVEINNPDAPSAEDQVRDEMKELLNEIFGSVRQWFHP